MSSQAPLSVPQAAIHHHAALRAIQATVARAVSGGNSARNVECAQAAVAALAR